jgi:hypothetical protein
MNDIFEQALAGQLLAVCDKCQYSKAYEGGCCSSPFSCTIGGCAELNDLYIECMTNKEKVLNG